MKLFIGISIICVVYLFGPWLLSFPVKTFTRYTIERKRKKYNPELITCPACGYRGDKRSDFKSVNVEFKRTLGEEKGALECTCFRCGAQPLMPLYSPADKWLPNISIEELKSRL